MSTVFLLIPQMMLPFVYSPEKAALHVAIASALQGICVCVSMFSSDKTALPGGPVVQCGQVAEQPRDEWAVKSSCQHRQPPIVSRGAPYAMPPALLCSL